MLNHQFDDREVQARLCALKADIQAAIAESENGESEPLDIDEIKRELMVELDSRGRAKQ